MLDVKKLISKIATAINGLNDDVVYYEKSITTNISAGSIGTRGAQVSFTNPAPFGYYIRSIYIVSVAASSLYSVMPFYQYNNNTFYVNFYRCTSSAVTDANATIRIVYTKSQRGGRLS